MRLWFLHPKYLDCKGLVALWRESLLAKKVLEGKTKGYKNHPQLDPFKSCDDPLASINTYLLHVWEEGKRRGYKFDRSKIGRERTEDRISLKTDEVAEEWEHLKRKLKKRDVKKYVEIKNVKKPELNPLFVRR